MVDQRAFDRRSGIDRREHADRRRVPERRSGSERRDNGIESTLGAAARGTVQGSSHERRGGADRRTGADNRIGIDRRSGIDRRVGVGWREADLGNRLSPESALELVSDFYSASMDSRFWPTALSKLAEALNASACALIRHDFGINEGRIEHAVGFDVASIESYGAHYVRGSEWLQREECFRKPGAVIGGEELVADPQVDGSEFFVHWLAPQGLRHQLFGVADRRAHDVLCVYAARSQDAGPFDDAEVALLRRLLPYLQRGLRAGQVLARTQNMRQVAMDALDLMPVGVLMISAGGAVLGANRIARDIVAARDVLSIGRSGLEVIKDGRRNLFRDLVSDGIRPRGNRPAPQVAFSVSRPSGQRALSVLIWPVSDYRSAEPGWDDPAALVFLGDPERSAEIDEGRLRQLYGLTAAEARVAGLLARGYRLDEIAGMLHVAYETTRKHLKKVLSKVETDRQADLVRTLVTGPGGLNR